MQRFKNILFVSSPGAGIDGGLRRAFELAHRNEGRLTIVQLVAARPDALSGDLGVQIDGLMGEVEEEQRKELSQLADALEAMGHRPTTGLLSGKPFIAIVQEVLKNGHDLVMKTVEGPTGGFRGRLFGSADQHLMRKCPCPVWLVKGRQREGFRSVLAAVDVGQGENPDLNGRILQLASSLAASEGSELHIVHAWSLAGEALLLGPARRAGGEVLEQLFEVEEIWRTQRLEALVSAEVVSETEAQLHVVREEAAEGIAKVAGAVEADVVVMGTLSRAGVRGLLIGNTAETVLSRLDCSVLTVKPEGFETPVAVQRAESEPPNRL